MEVGNDWQMTGQAMITLLLRASQSVIRGHLPSTRFPCLDNCDHVYGVNVSVQYSAGSFFLYWHMVREYKRVCGMERVRQISIDFRNPVREQLPKLVIVFA